LTSVPDRPGATIVFDQLLQISEAQLSVLGLKGGTLKGFRTACAATEIGKINSRNTKRTI
jgi:hypothetical protein